MSMHQAESDQELERTLRRALSAGPYPTAAQRSDGWAAVRAQAATQTVLPALEPAPARHWLRPLLTALWSLRTMLIEEAAYRRAHREDQNRTTAWARAPYVQFQPMW